MSTEPACVSTIQAFLERSKEGGNIVVVSNSQWPDAPGGMPSGYKQSLIQGSPRAAEPFTFRAKIPAHWRALPHFHPIDEHMTVLQGTCFLGIGVEYKECEAIQLGALAFTVMKANTVHFLFAKEECIIQVHGVGPHKITYVNPADDPRNGS